MPAINRKLTVHRQGAYYVAQGRIKKRQLVLPQVTKRSTSQPGLRLLRPQRDFFFPPSLPTKCPSNLECQPPVILEWVWGLVNQVSFVYPGIDAIACQKKKKKPECLYQQSSCHELFCPTPKFPTACRESEWYYFFPGYKRHISIIVMQV